jgi:hypothetical protein
MSGKGRDSSVDIATGYGLEDRGSRVRFPAGAGNFSLHHRIQNGSGAHPASNPMGNGGSFPGVKWLGREADHSPPSRDVVKECVELYLHFRYAFMAWCLVKHRDNFSFTVDVWRHVYVIMATICFDCTTFIKLV